MFKSKKFLAIVMTLMMVVSVLPGTAFAADGDVKVQINDGGSEFSVNLNENIKFTPTVKGADEGTYHIHWTKTNNKKYVKFVKNNEELDDEMISSNNIQVKGLMGTGDTPANIKVDVINGSDHAACSGEVLVSKTVTLSVNEAVKDPYVYGPQGKDQTVEVISPAEITQLLPNAENPDNAVFVNEFTTDINPDSRWDIVFKMGSGMGAQYDETAFIESGIKNIFIYDAEEKNVVASYEMGNLTFMGRDNDVDRNLTIRIAQKTLKGNQKYVLVFKSDMAAKAGGKTLGADVKFMFNTAKGQVGNVTTEDGFRFKLYSDNTAGVLYKGNAAKVEFPSSYTVKGENGEADVTYTVTEIAFTAMVNNHTVEHIVIPDSVKIIAQTAITNCDNLKILELPDSIEEIGDSNFYGCENLKTFTVPKNCKSIGNTFLVNGMTLDEIKVAEGNTHFVVVDNVLYNVEMTRLIALGPVETLVVPETVTEIAEQVFMFQTRIKHVVLPENLAELDIQMFNGCTNLETVVLPSGIPKITSNLFNNCGNLKEVDIPVSVTVMEGNSFMNCASIKEIVVPKNAVTFDQNTFANCTSLESAILPDGIVELPRRVFRNCNSLKFVTLPPTLEEGKIHNQLFQGITDLTQITICGEKGSYVESYAEANGMQFVEWVRPEIKTETINTATVGKAFEQKLEGIGVPAPIWYVIDGELPEGVTLSKDGVISGTPTEVGTYTFSVDAYNMGTATKEFTMEVAPVYVGSIELDKSELNLVEGETAVLTATAMPEDANDKTVAWTSSDETVATVDAEGNVTAVKAGTAVITATANDGSGIKAECAVTVKGLEEAELAIKIDDEVIEITDDLKAAGITTKEEVVEYLYSVILEDLGYTADTDNTVIWDVTLMTRFDENSEWIPVSPDAFPAEGIDMVLPYPEGTDPVEYDYTVYHMVGHNVNGMEAGDVEVIEPVEAENGLLIHVDGLSPFAITWQLAEVEESPEPPVDDVPGTMDDSEMDTNSDTDANADSNTDSAAQTGDNSNMMPFFLLMIVALVAAGIAVHRRRID